jgi:RimJ/RimL family protein N-acetyltransferase
MAGDYLCVRPINIGDAAHLAAMLQRQSKTYVQFFDPFSFDEATVSKLLARKDKDLYMGMYWQEQIAGFFMLRGWDEGYEVPSYGVLVDERFSGFGFGRISLGAALTICRLLKAPRLMLKVHPSNKIAKRLYESAGFVHSGFDKKNGNLIYYFDL